MQIEVVNKRVQRRRAGLWIDRRTVLGNPFPVDRTRGDKEAAHREAVEKYLPWLRQQWTQGGKVKQELVRLVELAMACPAGIHEKHPDSAQLARESAGTLTLLCWCKPYPCHGDVVKAAIEGIVAQQRQRLAGQ